MKEKTKRERKTRELMHDCTVRHICPIWRNEPSDFDAFGPRELDGEHLNVHAGGHRNSKRLKLKKYGLKERCREKRLPVGGTKHDMQLLGHSKETGTGGLQQLPKANGSRMQY